MSPDPFRSLDGIDPPDRWDEIARRAASDELVVDLDETRRRHPRRRAAGLVAAAAAIALLAGVAVANAGDPAEQDVAASDPTTTPAEPSCPFHLDPEAGYPTLTPGLPAVAEPEPGRGGLHDALLTTSAHAVIEGRTTIVTVGSDPTSSVRTDGIATVFLADGSTRLWLHTGGDLTATAGPAVAGCEDADVYVDVTDKADLLDPYELTDEEEAAGETLPETPRNDLIRDGELTPIDATARQVFDAIDLEPKGDLGVLADLSDACADVLANGPMATAAGTDAAWTGTTADGRTFTVEDDGTDVWVSVDGDVGGIGMSRPGDLNPIQWYGDNMMATGITVGVRHPDAAAIGAVSPDGSVHTAGLVLSPDGTLFAIPDMPLVPDPDGGDGSWPVVSCAADGSLLPVDEAVEIPDPSVPVGVGPTAPADPGPTTTETSRAETMTWEGPVAGGGTYRVEVDGDTTRAFVGEVMVGEAEQATPSWTDPMRAPGLWFEDGGPGVVVGAVPPGTVETVVLDEAGQEVTAPSLTQSPDGAFSAVLVADLQPGDGSTRAVRYRAADGTLFPIVPNHDAARGITGG